MIIDRVRTATAVALTTGLALLNGSRQAGLLRGSHHYARSDQSSGAAQGRLLRPARRGPVNWWNSCTGMDASTAVDSPLWLSRFGSAPGPMPSGWSTFSFWRGRLRDGVDFDSWNGSYERFKYLACDGPC